MPSPFPGMDPYIECHGNWQDFHNSLIAEIRDTLGLVLPPDYIPRIEERVEIVGVTEEGNWFRPDVLIAHPPSTSARAAHPATAGAATLAPTFLEVYNHPIEEIHETWLEIRRMPDLDLVTTIEVLSFANKLGHGRDTYLEKRRQLHARRVNLVEIDLLLGGLRLPMKPSLPPADYHAIVGRGGKLPVADVYSWTIHDPLPTIPIPLRAPDPDAEIDLARLIGPVYDRGRYALTLYRNPKLPEFVPLSAEDREWVEGVANSMRLAGRKG